MNRVIKVARMQLINKGTFIGIPAMILVSAFLFTLVIWWLVRRNGAEGIMYGGGAQAPMWYFLALGIQALTLTFPFSMAMSISRRSFYLGTVALFSVCALVLSVFYYLMGLVEKATGGWGLTDDSSPCSGLPITAGSSRSCSTSCSCCCCSWSDS